MIYLYIVLLLLNSEVLSRGVFSKGAVGAPGSELEIPCVLMRHMSGLRRQLLWVLVKARSHVVFSSDRGVLCNRGCFLVIMP